MKEKLFDILLRIHELVIKLISVKTVVFAVATYLRAINMLDNWSWAAFAMMLISVRAFEKYIWRKLP